MKIRKFENLKKKKVFFSRTLELFILRYEKCPCEDWQKDIEYYSEIGKIIDKFLIDNNNQRQILLCNKIKEQLAINGNISRNRNKTTEELFVGWND